MQTLPSLKQLFANTYRLFKFRADKLFMLFGGLQLFLAVLAWILGADFSAGATASAGTALFALVAMVLSIYVSILSAFLLKTTITKEDTPLRELLVPARRKFWPLVGASALVSLATITAVVILILIPLLCYTLLGNNIVSMMFALLFGLACFLALMAGLVYILFYNLAIILQDVPLLKSFRKSVELVRGNFWYVVRFFLCLMLILLALALTTVILQILFLLVIFVSTTASAGLIWLCSLVLGVCSSAFAQCALVVFYMNISHMIQTTPEPNTPDVDAE